MDLYRSMIGPKDWFRDSKVQGLGQVLQVVEG